MASIDLETTSGFSIKEKLKQWVVDGIQSGKFKSNEAIPSINTIASNFQISRESVRLSLDKMVKQGLVVLRKGKGFFVVPRDKRLIRIAMLSRIGGVYVKPIYEGLKQSITGEFSMAFLDSHLSEQALETILDDLAVRQTVDRLLIVPPRGQEEMFDKLVTPLRRTLKVAWFDRAPRNTRDMVFLCDYEACVRMAITHLRERGISRLHYFSRQPEDQSVFSTMRRTFSQETDRAGILHADWHSLLSEIHANPGGSMGVVAETDTEAAYLISRLTTAGIRVPAQVSVVCCDNSDLTDLLSPSITAIDPGFLELGRLAGMWILNDQEEKETQRQPITAKPYLVKKESTL